MQVIAFTGLPGSGKSVAVDAVRSRGIPVVRMGDHVIEEVKRRGLPLTEQAIGPIATAMRNEHGADVWARRTIDAIRLVESGTHPPILAVDGIRSLAEVERFKADLGPDFTLIAIEAPDPVRHDRLISRGRDDDMTSRDLAEQRDAREKGWGVDEAMQRADHTLHNNGGLEAFQAEIRTLLDRLVVQR